MVLPRWPVFDEEQIAAAAEVLRSGRTNYWSGTRCRHFEQDFAEYCGAEHALSTANGTLALELALVGLGIGRGDEVIVPARSFIATASAVVMRGAVPVFADVDSGSQNLSAASVRGLITERTRAIIAVHLSGWPCPMDALCELAAQNDLLVIEDCAQAHGAAISGRRVGSFGDAAAFSFCQDKIMSTGGEGGMLLCRDPAVFSRAWSHREHGKHTDALEPHDGSGYRWVHERVGTNARMTEFQAAIGIIQLRRLDDWVLARQRNARRLASALADCAMVQVAMPPPGIRHAGYRLATTVATQRLRPQWSRDRIVAALRALGIPCSSGVCPTLYREKALSAFAPPRPLAVAERIGETTIDLCLHPGLDADHLAFMAHRYRDICQRASR